MSKKLKLPLLFTLVFSFLLLCPSPTLAIYWSTPEKINTSSNNSIYPTITTGPNGYLHSAWMELNISGTGSDFWYGLNPGIFYSYWNGDAWSTPTKISQSTDWTGFPGIAITSDNHVHIIWEDDGGEGGVSDGDWGRIFYSQYDGNSWSTPVSISTDVDVENGWASHPQIVKDSADNLHVLFSYFVPTGNDVEAYYTKWNGSSWSTAEKLIVKVSDNNLQYPTLAVDSNNYPHVVLWELSQGIYHTNFNGTSWETPVLLSAEGKYPKIAIDGNDYRHVIWINPWYDTVDHLWKDKVEYVRWDGSWSTSPTNISDNCYLSPWGLPITAVTHDSNNNVYVGWGERVGWDGDPYHGVQASFKMWNGSVWSSAQFLRLTYDLDTPYLYKDIWDNQHLTWAEENQGTGLWEFWFSTVPVNVKDYNQAAFDLSLSVTGDSLSIPPNALTEPVTISAQIGPVPASADPGVTTIPRSYTFRPHGTTFITGKEAEAKINYDDSEVIGSDEANLKVYIWDSGQNAWSSSFTTSVQTNKNEITVTLPHFSLFGIMAPKVKASWLPPISKAETYELKEGSALPVKFTLNHFDDTPLSPPELPEDVVVKVKDGKGDLVPGATYSYGTGGDNVRYDSETGQYIVNIHTQELDLEPDTYTVEVLIFGQSEATKATSTQFEIIEKGKVKGTSSE